MNLVYRCGHGKNGPVVYKGSSADGIMHTICLADGSNISVHDNNLQLLEHHDIFNIPKTPLDYRNEVGTGSTLEEAQNLARPRPISPLQQELMSWHHRLYYIPFHNICMLASNGSLKNRLLECRNNLPLCVACQSVQAHHRPWSTKVKKSGSIRRKEHNKPGYGISVDKII